MTDIRRVLRYEMEELERQLESDPRFLKLQNLRSLLELYESDSSNSRHEPPTRLSRSSSTERDRALNLAEKLLEGRLYPTRTADILNYLLEEGVIIEGQSPVSNLSAMLSRAPQFESHGRSGWTVIASDNDSLATRSRSESQPPNNEEDILDKLLS